MVSRTEPRIDLAGKDYFHLWMLGIMLLMLLAGEAIAAERSASSQQGTNMIAIKKAVTSPGSTVEIPVTLSAATDIAGVNIRIEYDPVVFSSPGIVRGSLMENQHLLFSENPVAGRFCALAYSYDSSSFTAQNGTVFSLSFEVSSEAPTGEYPVTFSIDNSGVHPSSGLTDLAGSRMDHMQSPGTISVEEGEELMYDINKDDVVDAADLALFCSDWIHSSTDGRCNFDFEGEVDKHDLMLFSTWWMYDNR